MLTNKDVLKEINDERLASKGKWYFINLIYKGKHIQIKGYDTWLQIFKIDGKHQTGRATNGDAKVSEFKQTILESLENAY